MQGGAFAVIHLIKENAFIIRWIYGKKRPTCKQISLACACTINTSVIVKFDLLDGNCAASKRQNQCYPDRSMEILPISLEISP